MCGIIVEVAKLYLLGKDRNYVGNWDEEYR